MSDKKYYRETPTRRMRRGNRHRINFALAIGAVVLIILLFIWLTFADLAGDTDVAAYVASNFALL